MADFKPSEARKASILAVHAAPADTPPSRANREWVEIVVNLDGDLANWRLARVRPQWREEVSRPMQWEWIYTWGSPAFVRAGEVYRIHSGSRVRAATHPEPDDLVPGRKHVYTAGPLASARLIWQVGDYVRLLEAFGAVIDEVIVIPPEEEPQVLESARARGR
jgi:hypothetical protein